MTWTQFVVLGGISVLPLPRFSAVVLLLSHPIDLRIRPPL